MSKQDRVQAEKQNIPIIMMWSGAQASRENRRTEPEVGVAVACGLCRRKRDPRGPDTTPQHWAQGWEKEGKYL